MTKKKIKLTEVSLRDGSHVMSHQYTEQQVSRLVKQLDASGVPYIEVSHGDGLGGSSLQYGLSGTAELRLIEAAVANASQAKISVLVIPGIGTVNDLEQAAKLGIKMARIATHVTEANLAKQHIYAAKKLGLEVVGFLMMAHMASSEKIVEQAKLMESYGADVVYIVDSAGALLPSEVGERICSLVASLTSEVGFHGHNNLSLAMGNTIAAIEAGATRIDASIRCLGAGAGNTQTEVLVAVLEKMGIPTGIDVFKIIDLAEEVVAPMLIEPQEITRDRLLLGYLGLYSSFLLHVKAAAKQYGVASKDILIALAKQKVVGGQEDMIYAIANRLAEHTNG